VNQRLENNWKMGQCQLMKEMLMIEAEEYLPEDMRSHFEMHIIAIMLSI
jgi:hypothetical protein